MAISRADPASRSVFGQNFGVTNMNPADVNPTGIWLANIGTQVIVPGAADTIVLPPRDQVPEKFKNRTLNFHNPTMTTMRTTAEENVAIAEFIAAKLNQAKGPVVVMLPLGGLSSIDRPDRIFYDPEANGALFDTLKRKLSSRIEIIEDEHHLDDPEFAIRVGNFPLLLQRSCHVLLMSDLVKAVSDLVAVAQPKRHATGGPTALPKTAATRSATRQLAKHSV